MEDNELNRELVNELLQGVGIELHQAFDGQQALDLLERDADFDGVLMDCQMPVMDGYTATQLIRQQPRFATLPVIAMTANAISGDRERVLACGMNDHIAKPLNVDIMFATLARWIRPRARLPAAKVAEVTLHAGIILPVELDGIDQAAGLATCQGHADLYQRLLHKFLAAYRGFAEQFEVALADPDPAAAARLAHSLKGTAGNIGAFGITQAAAELERLCQTGAADDLVQASLAEVELRLGPVLDALACLGEEQPAPKPRTQESDPYLQPRLARLGRLLAESDSEAVEALLELRALALAPALAERLARVAQQVDRYDFDAALALLEG
ncbi:response regulator [Aeromonas eucrenophila]|uniref:Response regulator n=1 Tax=Aeromonas eucrenophila TaxID=649 RepID=A0ABW0Y4R6_9GAMM